MFVSHGFSMNEADKCVYSKFDVIMCLYVDDMLIFAIDESVVEKNKINFVNLLRYERFGFN